VGSYCFGNLALSSAIVNFFLEEACSKSLLKEAKIQIPYQNHSSDLQDTLCGTAKTLMFVHFEC